MRMFRAAIVVFSEVKFIASPFPGAGIIPAGRFVNEFNIVSNTDPDSHINRLSADAVGDIATLKSKSASRIRLLLRILTETHCLE